MGSQALLTVAAVLACKASAMGQTSNSWNGPSGNWSDVTRWTPLGDGPSPTDWVTLYQDDSVNRTVTYDSAATVGSGLSSIFINASGTGEMVLFMPGSSTNTLTTKWLALGNTAKGKVQHNGGTIRATERLFVGYDIGAVGTYNLSGGTIRVDGHSVVGNAGTGTFNQTGGAHITDQLYVGAYFYSTGRGTYNISGSSTLNANNIYIGPTYASVPQTTTGVMTISGGTVTANTVQISGSSGNRLNLTGGTLVVGALWGGPEQFNWTGGTVRSTTNFQLFTSASMGSGTTLEVPNGYTLIDTTRSLTQTGGNHTAKELRTYGTYTLSGSGSLNVATTDHIAYGGTFTQRDSSVHNVGTQVLDNSTYRLEGGTHNVTNELRVGDTTLVNAYYFLSGATASLTVGGSENIGYSAPGQISGGEIIKYGGSFSQTAGTHVVSGNLNVGMLSNATGLYSLSGGSLEVRGAATVGSAGTGKFTHTGGTFAPSYLTIGGSSSGSGTYELGNTGALTVPTEVIGSYGAGVFRQTGGTHTVTNNFFLGQNNSTGMYLQTGGIHSGAAEWIGYGGKGFYEQRDGVHNVVAIQIGVGTSGEGTYTLADGTLTVSSGLYVGRFAKGSFIQTGGKHELTWASSENPTFVLGDLSAATGSYRLEKGTLTVANDEYVGRLGTGVFNQSGGTNTIGTSSAKRNLYLGYYNGSNGSYTLSGTGQLSVSGNVVVASTSTFNMSNGTATLGGGFINNGAVNFSGGAIMATHTVFNNSNFNWTGGTLELFGGGSNLNVTNVPAQGTLRLKPSLMDTTISSALTSTLTNQGTIELNSAGGIPRTLTLQRNITNEGTINYRAGSGGTRTISGAVNSTGTISGLGDGTAWTLNISSLTLSQGGKLNFEVGAGTSDRINVSSLNGLNLAGSTQVNFTNLGTMSAGRYQLIDYNGGFAGLLSNLSLGTTPLGWAYSLENNTSTTSIDLLVHHIDSYHFVGPFNQVAWNDSQNWGTTKGGSGGAGVPGVGDNVYISGNGAGGVGIHLAPGNTQIRNLWFAEGDLVGTSATASAPATLTVDGTFTTTGSMRLRDGVTLNVTGAADLSGVANLDGDTAASVNFSGTVVRDGPGHTTFHGPKVTFGESSHVTVNTGELRINYGGLHKGDFLIKPGANAVLVGGYSNTVNIQNDGYLGFHELGQTKFEGTLSVAANARVDVMHHGSGLGGTLTFTSGSHVNFDPQSELYIYARAVFENPEAINVRKLEATGGTFRNGGLTVQNMILQGDGPAENRFETGTIIQVDSLTQTGTYAITNSTTRFQVNQFNLSGGEWRGILEVNPGGAMNWTGGKIGGELGHVIINPDATVYISGTGGGLSHNGKLEILPGGKLVTQDDLLVGQAINSNARLDVSGSLSVNGTLGVGNGAGGKGYVEVVGQLYADTIELGNPTGEGHMVLKSGGHVIVGGGLTSNSLIVQGGTVDVIDQDPPPGEDPVLDRAIVAGYLHNGGVELHSGQINTPYLKVGVTTGVVGTYIQSGGTLTTDHLLAGNGAGSVVQFTAGTINTGHTVLDTNSLFVVGGTESATLILTGNGTHSFADGLSIAEASALKGTGAIVGDVHIAGLLAPGHSPGTLTIDGDLTLLDGMSFDFELGTISDAIAVSGQLIYGSGALFVFQFSDAGGLAPGATYELITFGSSSGLTVDHFAFESALEGFDGAFTLTDGALQFTVVPEPNVAVATSLMALTFLARRRRRKN